jgi:HK97 family phage portal protein
LTHDLKASSEIRILGIKLFERRSSGLDLAYNRFRDSFLSQALGSQTTTGRRVTDELALTVSAVWGCVQILANTFAIPALNVYRKQGDIREIQQNHPKQILIHRKPNAYMTAFTWRRTMMMSAAITGNAYSRIIRNENTGAVLFFDYIKSDLVTPFLYKHELWYRIRGEELPVHSADMIHFKWLSLDGIKGRSPISIARENIGQALAIQDYGSKVFSEGGSKRVALKTPQKIHPDQKDAFRKVWNEEIAGTENLAKLMFLEGGSELVEIGMSPEDAQMLGVMKFKIEEICRIYGVPLHLVQSLDHATNNNIEHQAIQYVIYTMMAHYVNFEQELDYKLFPDDTEYYTRHNTNALMRGDMKTEAEYFGKMTDIGVYSINDIRKIKDENPIDDGDVHMVQVNRMPIKDMKDKSAELLKKLAAEASKNGNGIKVNTN